MSQGKKNKSTIDITEASRKNAIIEKVAMFANAPNRNVIHFVCGFLRNNLAC